MPGDSFHSATKCRFLPDSGLRAQCPNRHTVLGLLLDQRRRVSGSRLYRSVDRANHDDDEWRCSSDAAARLLHQSNRRLDDRLSVLVLLFHVLQLFLFLLSMIYSLSVFLSIFQWFSVFPGSTLCVFRMIVCLSVCLSVCFQYGTVRASLCALNSSTDSSIFTCISNFLVFCICILDSAFLPVSVCLSGHDQRIPMCLSRSLNSSTGFSMFHVSLDDRLSGVRVRVVDRVRRRQRDREAAYSSTSRGCR